MAQTTSDLPVRRMIHDGIVHGVKQATHPDATCGAGELHRVPSLLSNRWCDDDGIIHGWWVPNGFSELPRFTFCYISLFRTNEPNMTHFSYRAVEIGAHAPLNFSSDITCLACLASQEGAS